MIAEVYPMDKIVLDGISIELGMPQSAVETRLGKGDAVRSRRYYCSSDLAIHYAQDGTVEFIEFLGGPGGSLKPILYGVSAFDVPAEALVDLLREKNGGTMLDTEHGYSYTFPNISVGIYRERRPSDVQELIAEMKADGIHTEGNADVAAELQRANHWATLGIGIPGYYR